MKKIIWVVCFLFLLTPASIVTAYNLTANTTAMTALPTIYYTNVIPFVVVYGKDNFEWHHEWIVFEVRRFNGSLWDITNFINKNTSEWGVNITNSLNNTNIILAYTTNIISNQIDNPGISNVYVIDNTAPVLSVNPGFGTNNSTNLLPVAMSAVDLSPNPKICYGINFNSPIAPNKTSTSNLTVDIPSGRNGDWYLTSYAYDMFMKTNVWQTNVYHVDLSSLTAAVSANPSNTGSIFLTNQGFSVEMSAINGSLVWRLYTNGVLSTNNTASSYDSYSFVPVTQSGTNTLVCCVTNWDNGAVSYITNTYIIDTLPPTLSVVTAVTNSIIYTNINYTYSFDGSAISGSQNVRVIVTQRRFNGTAWVTELNNYQTNVPYQLTISNLTKPGTNVIKAYTLNTLSTLTNGSLYSNMLVMDTNLPTVSFTPAGTNYNYAVTNVLIGIDTLSPVSIYYSINHTNSIVFDSLYQYTNINTNIFRLTNILQPDPVNPYYCLSYYAVDQAGNTGTNGWKYYIVDNGTPGISLVPASINATNFTNQVFSANIISSNGGIVWVLYTNGVLCQSNTYSNYGTNSSAGITFEGTNRLITFASNANNGRRTVYITNTFVLDVSPPLIAYSSSNTNYSYAVTNIITVTDVLSPVRLYYSAVQTNAEIYSSVFQITNSYTNNGVFTNTYQPNSALPYYCLKFYTMDAAGNASATNQKYYIVDDSIPVVSVLPTNTGGIYYTNQTFSAAITASNGGISWSLYTNGTLYQNNIYSNNEYNSAAPIVAEGTNMLITFASNANNGSQSAILTNIYFINTNYPTLNVDTAITNSIVYTNLPYVYQIRTGGDRQWIIYENRHFNGTGWDIERNTNQTGSTNLTVTLTGTNLLMAYATNTVSLLTSPWYSNMVVYDTGLPVAVFSPSNTNYTYAVTNILSAADLLSPVKIYYSVNHTNSEIYAGAFQYTNSFMNNGSITNIFASDPLNSYYCLNFYTMDAAGNSSSANQKYYIVDSGVPLVSVAPSGGGGILITNQAFNAAISATGGGIIWSLYTNGALYQNNVYSNNEYNSTAPIVTEGTNMLLAYASNANNGNQSAILTNRYIVDLVPPVLSITPGSRADISAFSVSLSVTDYSASTIYYGLNLGTSITPNQSSAASFSLTIPSTYYGVWYLTAYAVDSAGRTNAWQTNQYTMNAGMPVISVTPALDTNLIFTRTNVNISYRATTGDVVWKWLTNEASSFSGTNSLATNIILSVECTNTLIVFASNVVDGSVSAALTNRIVVDKTNPVIFSSPSSGTTNKDTANIYLSAYDALSPMDIYYCMTFDDHVYENYELNAREKISVNSTNFSLKVDADKTKSFLNLLVFAVDKAGNQSPWIYPWYFFELERQLKGPITFSENPFRLNGKEMDIYLKKETPGRVTLKIIDINQNVQAILEDPTPDAMVSDYKFKGTDRFGGSFGRGLYLVIPEKDGKILFKLVRKLYILTQ